MFNGRGFARVERAAKFLHFNTIDKGSGKRLFFVAYPCGGELVLSLGLRITTTVWGMK